MKIDSLKLIAGNFATSAGFAFGANICLSVSIFREFGDARSCEPHPIVATNDVFPSALGEISSPLLAPRMFSGRSRFRLRLQQLRVDGSFEANSPRIRCHLAQATAFHCLFGVLGEISSALLAPRMFSGRSRFRLRLQQLRVWVDLLRPTARGSVLTLLRRPPFTDSLVFWAKPVRLCLHPGCFLVDRVFACACNNCVCGWIF